MDVVLVRWPTDAARRESLQRERRARLLLVESGCAAPLCTDALEDWIRVPADEADLRARIDGLRLRAGSAAAARPALDGDGLLRTPAGGRVALPPVEARIAGALLERFGAVVSRDRLAVAGWGEANPGRNALDVHVLRLRRRLAPIGLVIRTVRSRGYLMDCVEGAAVGPAPNEGKASAWSTS
ncbi:MAG: helix-turn-helix domain-containing protein [Acidimicrobiales bacterium]